MPFEAADEQILNAAKEYLTILAKADQLVSQAPDRILSGGPSTVYLKKLGHRPLKPADAQAVINALGTENDRKVVTEFRQAQEAIVSRLQNTNHIGLIVERANIPYDQVYKRSKRPELWKPEQMMAIMETIRQLQL